MTIGGDGVHERVTTGVGGGGVLIDLNENQDMPATNTRIPIVIAQPTANADVVALIGSTAL